LPRITRLARATLLATLGLAVAAPVAGAACPAQTSGPVFAPWGDLEAYTAAPNGGFEAGSEGWTLAGAARLVGDNAGLIAQSAGGVNALELPPGSSATSPRICVGAGYPTSRMFGDTVVRNPASGSTLQVEVLYTDRTRGLATSKKLGTVPDQLAWAPTRKLSIAQGQLNIKPDSDGSTYVRYRFTPLYKTTWRIDDLYVDPRMKY
jgi:hypothetical protein